MFKDYRRALKKFGSCLHNKFICPCFSNVIYWKKLSLHLWWQLQFLNFYRQLAPISIH